MKTLIFFLAASLLLAACNIVRIDVPVGATVQPGGITIEQNAYKAASGESAVAATTAPTTDANLGLK